MNYSFKSTHFKRSTLSFVSLEQKSLAWDYPLCAINLQNREMNPFLPLSLLSADWFRNKLGLLTCVTNFSGALGHVRSRDVTQASRGQTANGNTLTPETSNIYLLLRSHPISFSLSYLVVMLSHLFNCCRMGGIPRLAVVGRRRREGNMSLKGKLEGRRGRGRCWKGSRGE